MIPVWFLYLAGFSMVILGVLQLLHRPHKAGRQHRRAPRQPRHVLVAAVHHRRRGAARHGARLLAGAARAGRAASSGAQGSAVSLDGAPCVHRRSSRSPRAASTPASATRRSTGSRAPASRRAGRVRLAADHRAAELPTCAYLDSPTVTGSLHVSDPDGDAQVIKAALYTGPHNNEADIQLDDAGRSGNDWTGQLHAQHHAAPRAAC